MNAPISPPSKHTVTLVTFLALVPLVYLIPEWIRPFLPDNRFVQVTAAVAIIVPIISYLIMPTFFRCHQKWQRNKQLLNGDD